RADPTVLPPRPTAPPPKRNLAPTPLKAFGRFIRLYNAFQKSRARSPPKPPFRAGVIDTPRAEKNLSKNRTNSMRTPPKAPFRAGVLDTPGAEKNLQDVVLPPCVVCPNLP